MLIQPKTGEPFPSFCGAELGKLLHSLGRQAPKNCGALRGDDAARVVPVAVRGSAELLRRGKART